MSETKGNTPKNLFVFIVIVAILAGLYVLNMNKFNGLLGIEQKTPPTAMAAPTDTPNFVTGGSGPAMSVPATPPPTEDQKAAH